MLPIFACAIFLSAALLFAVQPIVGKLVLPTLGGSPAVWNTCMLFFQTLLLGGYSYAHLISKRLALKTQIIIHLALLALAAVTLPIALPAVLPEKFQLGGETLSTIAWLICLLFLTAGAPFLLLSATAPLLQSWFSRTSHQQAKDPYFLYVASNAGSIIGLLAYPMLIEPNLGLAAQGKSWSFAYTALIVTIAAAAAFVVRQPTPATSTQTASSASKPTRNQQIHWIFLAAVPSSVSLGVTQFISTDIASIPLLWILPLLLYLLSFIFAFSKRGVNIKIWSWILAGSSLIATYLLLTETRTPILPVLSLHLLVLFSSAMVCHGTLAAQRPPAQFLTSYYLLMSLGGMLGGVFNAILAPLVLPIVFEYQLATVAAVALSSIFPRRQLNIAFTIVLLGLFLAAPIHTYFFDRRVIYTERTFFGVHRVVATPNVDKPGEDAFRTLYHGTTIHGVEARYLAPHIRPASYFHPTGPIGQVLTEDALGPTLNSIAVIGLGAGSLALYNEDGCTMNFYEIDPAVIRIARDSQLFDYMSPQYTHGKIQTILGDGRLEIAKAPDHSYGVIILDAFSSDSIPTHLLTREALALYRKKLRPNGIIAIHISNIFFDLQPIVAKLAADAGLTARVQLDKATFEEMKKEAKSSSQWCILSAHDSDLGPLAKDPRWSVLKAAPSDPLWTDDYSNVLKVLRRQD